MKINLPALNNTSWKKWLPVAIAGLLAVHHFNYPFYEHNILSDSGPTWLGIDVSWEKVMNHALTNDSTWGTDVIYTYGPLSFFATRNGLGISRWIFLLFDLFVIINFFFVFKDFIKRSLHPILAVLTLIAMALLMNPRYGGELPWILMAFIIFWMYKSYEEPRYSYLIMTIVLITLSFFIKMNTGLIGILFFAAHLVNLTLFRKIEWKKAAITLAGAISAILFVCWLMNVSIINYIISSFEIIKGYNEVMYLEQDQFRTEWNLKMLFRVIVVLYLVYAFFLVKAKRYAELFFVAVCLAFEFLFKKQCVVRNDIQHLSDFFNYAPLVLLSGNLLTLNGKVQPYISASITTIIIVALLFNTERKEIDTAFKDRYGTKRAYVQQFRDFKHVEWLGQKDERFIPQRVLDKIGNETTDVFPWDNAYLLENKLNYTPRPIFQSFSAYTAYLQNVNYDFYVRKAPSFIIFDYDAIDERYAFNEEPMLHLYLAKNYTIADTFTSNERWRLLLQKKQEAQPINLQKIKEVTAEFGKEIDVNGATIIKVFTNYNLKGKLRSFKYRAPRIDLQMMKQNGEWVKYKTSTELLMGGIMVDKLILSNHEFAEFMSHKDSLPKITRIKIDADKAYFSPEIRLQYLRD